MKKFYPKSNSVVFKLCLILLSSVAIIYGCKKERAGNKEAALAPPGQTITDAKTWFERTYPAGSSTQATHTTVPAPVLT